MRRYLEPRGLPCPMPQVARHLAQVGRARILGVVHPMAETWNLLLPRELRPHELLDSLRGRCRADVQEHPHHVGVRPPVQRPLEGANGADDGRMDVGQGRGRHAGRKCRRIQLVVGMQDQRDVEGVSGETGRALAGEHVQKVGGMAEHRIRLDRSSAGVHPAHRRDERAELRGQADGLAMVGVRGTVGRIRIVVTECRRERPQRIHQVAFRQRPHQTDDGLRQRARRGELGLEIAELRAGRQPMVPQKVADFLERGVARQIVNVVAAVGEHAAIAVEMTDGGGRRDDIFEPGPGLRGDGHVW